MAKKKSNELSVENKLRTLYDLQLIESKIDELRSVRGELPLEVQSLEDEIEGLKLRKSKIQEQLDELQESVKQHQNQIISSGDLIARYKSQLDEVQNSKQFDALNKEIEYQELEVKLSNKRIKEGGDKSAKLQSQIDTVAEKLDKREEHLKLKKEELHLIIEETEKDEERLNRLVAEMSEKIEERLLKAYRRIRNSVKNGLAVVPIQRGASGGSFFAIPPQIQMEAATRRRIVIDEHSGRILVDPELAAEQQKKIEELLA